MGCVPGCGILRILCLVILRPLQLDDFAKCADVRFLECPVPSHRGIGRNGMDPLRASPTSRTAGNVRLPFEAAAASEHSVGRSVLDTWLPARSHSVAHPHDMRSVDISLKRGSCYGACPVYEIRIQGDGSARYEGTTFVRTKGPEIVKIAPQMLTNLLESFDRRIPFQPVRRRSGAWNQSVIGEVIQCACNYRATGS